MRVKIGKNSPSRGQIQSSIFLTAANIPGGPDEDSNFAVNNAQIWSRDTRDDVATRWLPQELAENNSDFPSRRGIP